MIAIIIVNWNAGHQLHDCINSIKYHHNNIVEQVIIIDNASTDKSLSSVESIVSLPFDLKIIRNNQNCGFAAACNQGALIAKTKYLLFLNPDTLLFDKSLTIPYQFMSNPVNKEFGICGIQLVDELGNISRTCSRFPASFSFILCSIGLHKIGAFKKYQPTMMEWSHNVNQSVDQIIGAFFFVRSSLFERLKGFDERFFVYFEEVDFSYRAHKIGYQSIYLSETQAFHRGGGTSSQVKARRLFYSLRSRMLYAFKHFPKTHAWLVMSSTLVIEPLTRTLLALIKFNITDVKNVWNAYFLLVSDMPSWFKKKQ